MSHVDPFVGIDALVIDPAYQIRSGKTALNRWQVKRYADAMKAGQTFPPVKAMRVNGALFLIDGFHRVQAAKHAGCTEQLTVEIVGEGTPHEARWLAFDANRQHGLPLKTREMRDGFKAYVRAGKHKHAKGKLKSYREMAADLGIGHTTIRHWMQRYFPSVFRAMQGPQAGTMNTEAAPPDQMELTPMTTPVQLLDQAIAWAAQRADDAAMNAELLARAERLIADLKDRPMPAPGSPMF